MTPKTQKQQPGFEKALERLERLVAEMEESSLSLDKMMAHFEEGMSLVRFCSERLNEVERRIEILLKKGDKIIAAPFEAGAEAPEAVEPESNGEDDGKIDP